MAFIICLKDFDNKSGSFVKIAENQNDLNNSNINQLDYKILEVSQENFNAIKYKTKIVDKYNNDEIFYLNQSMKFLNKTELQKFIDGSCFTIQNFLVNNSNHPYYNQWNNYKNQLKNLNLNNITYPLNKSLEQYFNDLGQPSYNILQLP